MSNLISVIKKENDPSINYTISFKLHLFSSQIKLYYYQEHIYINVQMMVKIINDLAKSRDSLYFNSNKYLRGIVRGG